jgi:ribosomal protein L11 methyltransferase
MDRTWWQITIGAGAGEEDFLFWLLQNWGCQGMETVTRGEGILVSAYVSTTTRSEADLAEFAHRLAQDYGIKDITWQIMPEEDWQHAWRQHWQPDPVGKSLIIYPAWWEVPPVLDRLVIRLDPGGAFGSGAHPTTRLCLEALEEMVSPQTASFADLGCGSGILGIAAHRLGAQQIYSADIDPVAVQATRYNWELNQFPPDRLVVLQGSIEDLPPVDGFVCNILAEPILAMVPHFSRLGQWGILSGMLLEQVGVIRDALQVHGWTIPKVLQQEQWAGMIIKIIN